MKNNEKYGNYTMAFFLLPIIMLLAIVTLIVYNDSNSMIQSTSIFYRSPDDFFSTVKSGFIVVLGPLSLVCALFANNSLLKDFRSLLKDPVFIALGVYMIFVVLSTVFSDYRDVAIHGGTGRNEGMLVILSYFCIWLAVVLQVRHDVQVKIIMYSLYFFLTVSTVVGLSQVLGHSILTADFMRPFIMSRQQYEMSAGAIITMMENVVNLTFSNPNYVGSYMSMIFVVCFSMFLIAESKKYRVLHGVFSVISCFIAIICQSKAGYVAAVVSTSLVLIVLHKKAIQNWKSILLISVSVLVLLVTLNSVLGKSATLGFYNVFNRTSSRTGGASPISLPKILDNPKHESEYSSVEQYNKSGPIVESYEKGSLTISIKDNLFSIEDRNTGKSINIINDVDVLFFYDDADNRKIIREEVDAFDVEKEGFPNLSVDIALPRISIYFYEDEFIVHLIAKDGWFYFSTYDSKVIEAEEIVRLMTRRFVDDYSFEGNTATIITPEGDVFNIRYDGLNVGFTDGSGAPIEHTFLLNRAVYFLSSPGYEGYSIYAYGRDISVLSYVPVNFVYEDGKIRLLTDTKEVLDTSKPDVFPLLVGREKLFSKRGYIWGRSIPLLKDTVFIGRGPDNFVFYFPHYDLKACSTAFGNYTSFVDKPHMYYLQIGINTGILSLIAFLTSFALYYLRVLKLLLNKAIESRWFQYGICFAGGTSAYLVAGIINDSVVSVAPTFYVVFAMAYVCVRNHCDEAADSLSNGKAKMVETEK